MRIKALILLAVSVLSGCQMPTWQAGGVTHTSPVGDYSVRVPVGWSFLAVPANFLATVDGLILQRAGIQRQDLRKPLAYSKRVLSPALTPLELAEAIADDMRADRDMRGLEVTETKPAQLGGRPGCKIVLQFHNSEGLRLTEVIYSCTTEHSVYLLHFMAPTRHYFARDLAAFDEMARSFQILKLGTLEPYKVVAPAKTS